MQKQTVALLVAVLVILGAVYMIGIANLQTPSTGFNVIDAIKSVLHGPPTCTAGYKCYSATVLGYQNRKCKWSNLRACTNGCLNNACVSGATCLDIFSCSGTILVHQLTNCTNLTQNCPFGCANNACKPDSCIGITCPNVCQDANNLNTSGNCVSGSCKYTAVSCTYGCANNACNPNPCGVAGCPNIDFYGNSLSLLKVFGQYNFSETSRDTPNKHGIYHASGLLVDRTLAPNKIYVVDTGNNRILGFDSIGQCQNSPSTKCTNDLDCIGMGACIIEGRTRDAALIFGQCDENHAACNEDNNIGVHRNPTSATLCLMPFPDAANQAEYWMRTNIDVDSQGNLYVPDVHNNRVLKYSQPFSSDKTGGKGDTIADFVWGQNDMNSNGINHGLGEKSRDSKSLYISSGGDHVASRGISVDSQGNLWVADTFNGRILRFPSNSNTANLVLGYSDFSSYTYDECHTSIKYRALNKLCHPTLARVNPSTGQLYVLDEGGGDGGGPFEVRILVFNPPFTNGSSAIKVITPNQDGPFTNGWTYVFQATGLTFNTYRQGEYANGEIWVTEHQANRAILLDINGNILKVIGAPDKYHQGCDYGYYGRCKSPNNIFTDFNLCWPGGSVGIDNANNIYLADEHLSRIARFALPYVTQIKGSDVCVPDSNGGLLQGNGVSGYKFSEIVGAGVFQNQLFIKDQARIMVWNDYLGKSTGAKADFVIGQSSDSARDGNPYQISNRAFQTVDDKNRLWTVNEHGQIVIYQLPFKPGDAPLANNVYLYWSDTGNQFSYWTSGGLAFDNITKKMWVNNGNRIFRISNYYDFQNRLYVDMVLGQPNKDSDCCNQAPKVNGVCQSSPPRADTLCEAYQLKFDGLGNLFVLENNYECHGNDRIIVYLAQDLASASGMFPQLQAKIVFVADDLTSGGHCLGTNEPGSPVSMAFNSKNEMVVGNDGSYINGTERHLKQLYLYRTPLTKQTPDASIRVPMGAPGEITFDNQDNLIIQDHTWYRAWVINFEKDPYWLVPIP